MRDKTVERVVVAFHAGKTEGRIEALKEVKNIIELLVIQDGNESLRDALIQRIDSLKEVGGKNGNT